MQTIYEGLTIGEKHTYDDFGLFMTSFYIPEPTPKIKKIDLPFANGSIDLTDATGITPYEDRSGLEFRFEYPERTREEFQIKVQELSMFLHGKSLNMICDCDPNYYYIVRLSVDPKKTKASTGVITLKGVADPFKYSIIASHEPWLWNPFSFRTGQIISTSDVIVNGTTTVTIPAGGMQTSPSFIVTQAGAGLGVVYNTSPPRTLLMSSTGTFRFPQIRAGGENATTITLVGQGRVSVAYRSRYL